MAIGTTITEVLNQWNQIGVFSYVLPFLLIFAVVFAIVQKTKILGDNKGISAVIAVAVGLLSLQLDFVSSFFATIFPRFGVALGILLAIVILIGFFYEGEVKDMKWVGYTLGIGVVVWALVSWNWWGLWGDDIGISSWIRDNFWGLAIAAILIIVVVMIAKSGGSGGQKKGGHT